MTVQTPDTHEASARQAEQYEQIAQFYRKHAHRFPEGHPGREANLNEAHLYEQMAHTAREVARHIMPAD